MGSLSNIGQACGKNLTQIKLFSLVRIVHGGCNQPVSLSIIQKKKTLEEVCQRGQ